jgi:hypothetical protein
MMNPFIYSLRNKDMKEAFKKFISRLASLLWYFALGLNF